MTTPGACPAPEVLEALATGADADPAMSAHLESCATCRAAIEDVRENNRFLAAARAALATPSPEGPAREHDAGLSGPELVRGYEIQEELHRGGQGVVYRALQTRTRRTVAIKVLLGWHDATTRQRERFEREIRIAAGLRHPSIVTVHDSGFIGDGRYGLVMEYIDGVALGCWSESLDRSRGRDARRRALRERLAVMVKVCDAILYAHQRSIVHRDLKPANILVDSAGEPHVLDFGVARDVGPDEHTRLTHTGEFAGTLAYASPEQVSGDPTQVDTRTDIYSLGVILYELVSGCMPYPVDGSMAQTLRNIETVDPVPLSRRTREPDGPWIDGEIATIVHKALSKDPTRRYQTAAGLRSDLDRYLAGEAIEARRDSTWYVLRKTASRHRVAFAAAGLIVAILAVFGAAMAWQAHFLAAQGRELARALSDSNIERGRWLGAAGNIAPAEGAVGPELIRAGVTHVDGLAAGLTGSPQAVHAYWALWDIARHAACLTTLRAPPEPLVLLSFTTTGQQLNAVDRDGHQITWSVETWEPVCERQLIAPIDGVRFHFAAAADGRIAVFGGGFLRVVDPDTGDVVARAEISDDQALTGAFSPDGSLLATIGHDQRLRLRDARTLAIVVAIVDPVACKDARGDLCQPRFSSDARFIAAAGTDGSIGRWNAGSGVRDRMLRPSSGPGSPIRDGTVASRLAVAPDGAIVAAIGSHALVWSSDGSGPADLGTFGGNIESIDFLPRSEGRVLVASGSMPGGAGGVTKLWDRDTGAFAASYIQAHFVAACATSADGRMIAMGGDEDGDRAVEVFESDPEPYVAVLQSATGLQSAVAVSADGRLLAFTTAASGGSGRDVLLWDLESRSLISRVHRGAVQISALAFAPDGASLFECGSSGPVTQWDLPDGTVRREFSFPEAPDPPAVARPPEPGVPRRQLWGQNQMRLSPDGTLLAHACGDDGRVGLWDVPSGRWIDWLDSGQLQPAVIDLSPDGRTLAADHWGECVLWDLQSRQPRPIFHSNLHFPALRFGPDGALIAIGREGSIQFVDAGSGRVRCENGTLGTFGYGMEFLPGGSVCCTSAFDSSIRLWDTRTGRELLALRKHTELIVSMAITPDGRTLISADRSGLVLAWDLGYYHGRIRQMLERRLAREGAAADPSSTH